MNMSYVAELLTTGSNLNHQFKDKIKELFEQEVGRLNSLNSAPGTTSSTSTL